MAFAPSLLQKQPVSTGQELILFSLLVEKRCDWSFRSSLQLLRVPRVCEPELWPFCRKFPQIRTIRDNTPHPLYGFNRPCHGADRKNLWVIDFVIHRSRFDIRTGNSRCCANRDWSTTNAEL